MIEYFIWLMSHIREQIFERFIIPGLNVSYWDFCIALLVMGLLITVLVNGVKVVHEKNVKNVRETRKAKMREERRAQRQNSKKSP